MNGLKDIVFVDIETVPLVADFESLDDRMQALWTKKAGYLSKDVEILPADLWQQKAGIYAEFGKVICVTLGIIRKIDGEKSIVLKSLYGEEQEVLVALKHIFDTSFDDIDRYVICGHNIREFDIPYLCRRMMIHGITIPYILDVNGKKPWQIAHFQDTLAMWKFGDYKHYTSLDLLAACFGIPSPKSDISGADVGRVYYETGDFERIARYCERDVVTTIQVYLSMKGIPLIDSENIIVRK